MKEFDLNRYEFLERKRVVDASWFIILPFLLIFAGYTSHIQVLAIPFHSLLKANLVLTGCYIFLHIFIERVELGRRHLRRLTLLSHTLILLQITVSIHFMGGTEAFIFYPLYLLPIAASGILFSGLYPLGCSIISFTFLTALFLLENTSLVWYMTNLGMPKQVALLLENFSVSHYSILGIDPAPETLFTILLSYLFISLAFAFLAQATGPLLDRLYSLTSSMERDIKGREDLFNLSLFHAPTGFTIGYRAGGRLIYVNKSVIDTFGISEDEIRSKDLFSILPFSLDTSRLLREKIATGNTMEPTLMPMMLKDGHKAFFHIKLSFLNYQTSVGEEELFILILTNITEELELSNIVMNSRDAMIFADSGGAVNFLNRAASEIFPDLRKGAHLKEALSSSGAFPVNLYSEIMEGKAIDGKVKVGNRDKTFFFSSFTLKDMSGMDLGLLLTFKDVTNEELFYNLSIKDELTGLYNRRYFMEMMEKEISQARRYPKPLSLAMLDIDFFKKVNDTYGHQAGDIILKAFARTLTENVRQADLVARTGGEEFSLYIPFTDETGGARLCENLRKSVEGLATGFEERVIPITCSIGIAEYKEGDSVQSLISKADNALYEAKRTGRNRVARASALLGICLCCLIQPAITWAYDSDLITGVTFIRRSAGEGARIYEASGVFPVWENTKGVLGIEERDDIIDQRFARFGLIHKARALDRELHIDASYQPGIDAGSENWHIAFLQAILKLDNGIYFGPSYKGYIVPGNNLHLASIKAGYLLKPAMTTAEYMRSIGRSSESVQSFSLKTEVAIGRATVIVGLSTGETTFISYADLQNARNITYVSNEGVAGIKYILSDRIEVLIMAGRAYQDDLYQDSLTTNIDLKF